MDIEQLDRVLNHKNIKNLRKESFDHECLERVLRFIIDDQEYAIIWWYNVSYLNHNNITVPFVKVVQSGSWPNNKKLNLQFKDEHGDTCCIIGLEDY